jgi:hypothetical protein
MTITPIIVIAGIVTTIAIAARVVPLGYPL